MMFVIRGMWKIKIYRRLIGKVNYVNIFVTMQSQANNLKRLLYELLD